jgi:hypothetical protein
MNKKIETRTVIGKSLGESKAEVKNLPWFVAIAVFALTTLIFFWDQISGNAFFWEDIVRFVYPLQNFAAKEAAKGVIPFWNPFTFSGMPFLADLQVGFFYPLNRVLGSFMGADGNLSFAALQTMIILHFFISQINSFFLSRYLKISFWGSIIAAITYSFSMILVCHSIHPMIVQHLSWFPLILTLFIKGVKDKDVKSGVLSGLIYGLSMLSGHTQMSLYEGFILFLVFFWLFIDGLRKGEYKGIDIAKPIISSVLTVAIAAGIFMIQYMPSAELVKHSKRNKSTYEFVTEGSLQGKQTLTAFIPKLFGSRNGDNDVAVEYYLEGAQGHYYWETSFYFGICALALGLFGFLTNFKNNEYKMWLFLALFGFMFALGSNGFLFEIFYNLPFFNLFRNPARMMFITSLAFAVAAGKGFDTLYEKNKDKGAGFMLTLSVGIVGIVALFGAFGGYSNMFNTPEEFKQAVNNYGLYAAAFAIFTGFIAIGANKFKLNSMAAGALLVFAVFFDLYLAGADFNKIKSNPLEVYTDAYRQMPALKDTLSPKYPNNVFRVKMRLFNAKGQTIAKPLEDNQGMLDGIMLVEGYNPLLLNRMIIPISPSATINDMKNVKYELDIDSVNRRLAFMNKPNAFGNAWMTYQTKQIATEQLQEASLNNNFSLMAGIDFKNITVIEKAMPIALSGKNSDSVQHSVKVQSYESNKIVYNAQSSENALVCFSEMYYPEWHAYIDGKETEILAANYGFRAVPMSAGNHTIEMRYESAAYSTGKSIYYASLIGGVLAYAGLFFFDRKKRLNVSVGE